MSPRRPSSRPPLWVAGRSSADVSKQDVSRHSDGPRGNWKVIGSADCGTSKRKYLILIISQQLCTLKVVHMDTIDFDYFSTTSLEICLGPTCFRHVNADLYVWNDAYHSQSPWDMATSIPGDPQMSTLANICPLIYPSGPAFCLRSDLNKE